VPAGNEAYWDNKRQFRLGKTLAEAHKEFGKRTGRTENVRNVGALLDRYARDVVPTKAARTQKDSYVYIKRLKSVFGEESLHDIKPQDIYRYLDERKAKTSGRLEKALLSHAFTKAIQWGYITAHPFKHQLEIKKEKKARRYIEDWEIDAFMSLQPRRKGDSITWLQAYVELKLLTGLRKGDMLRLKESQLEQEGIKVTTGKTADSVIILWTDSLRNAIARVKAARPVDISPYLFCTRRGKPYIDESGDTSAFNSIWQRCMLERILKETNITERFKEHDLRAKASSDLERIEDATALLTHSDSKVTKAFYRRKTPRVRPTR
jgi:integrase